MVLFNTLIWYNVRVLRCVAQCILQSINDLSWNLAYSIYCSVYVWACVCVGGYHPNLHFIGPSHCSTVVSIMLEFQSLLFTPSRFLSFFFIWFMFLSNARTKTKEIIKKRQKYHQIVSWHRVRNPGNSPGRKCLIIPVSLSVLDSICCSFHYRTTRSLRMQDITWIKHA